MNSGLFIDGAWTQSTGAGSIDVENPATEEVIGTVPAGTAEDVDRAVQAALRAFPAWSATDRAERARLLAALRDTLKARQEEMARLITAEMGAPLRLAMGVQTSLPISVLSAYVDMLHDAEEEEHIGNSLVVREPVGVVAAITPWNYPLNQAMNKIAPALAAGNTVVHKPSELTPLSALLLAEMFADVGFPPGAYNLVTGTGPEAGEALVRHPNVDMVSFTGSTRAGRRVAALAADTVKRITLELGGKSANVILDDADLTAAVKVGVANCYLNAGQTCTALTRMLVPQSLRDDAVDLAVAAASKYVMGDPANPNTRLGPLVSATQRERVLSYVDSGVNQGARLVLGGRDAGEMPQRGYFVAPTVFADVAPDMTIAQEEIFGPVLSIISYSDDDEAVRIANDTMYGLAGAVWSRDIDHAGAIARRLRAGQVDINGAAFNLLAPFGGYKQSGIGREGGRYGLEEFQQLKSLQLP
jgi:acyl-CoA reductase-like NAD-dependent aldehyde dehydrogenase